MLQAEEIRSDVMLDVQVATLPECQVTCEVYESPSAYMLSGIALHIVPRLDSE